MAVVNPGTIGDINTALSYLRANLEDFFAKGPQMQAELEQARQNIRDAYQLDDADLQQQASQAYSDLILDINDWNDLFQQAKPVADYLGISTYAAYQYNSLGALPPLVTAGLYASAIIAFASAVYVWYLHYAEHKATREQAWALIQSGKATAAQVGGAFDNSGTAGGFFSSLGQTLGDASVFVLIGVGAYLVLTKKKA